MISRWFSKFTSQNITIFAVRESLATAGVGRWNSASTLKSEVLNPTDALSQASRLNLITRFSVTFGIN